MITSRSLGERGISSSPRSSLSLRSLVIPTQTMVPTMSTGIAAPMAVASTTRVRSEGVRAKIGDRIFMACSISSISSLLLQAQHESNSANCVQQPGAAVGLQLAAQVSDEYVDDVGVGGR